MDCAVTKGNFPLKELFAQHKVQKKLHFTNCIAKKNALQVTEHIEWLNLDF